MAETNNLWRWTWEDKDGNTETIESRGPISEGEMRQAATQIMDAMTKMALRSGAADPGLKIIDIQAAGHDHVSPFGAFHPVGARPLDLGRFRAESRETAAK